MTEKLLQFIWQFQYFNRQNLQTSEGEPLTVLHAGLLNRNQGPDFVNARIKIGSTTLAGSIELHLKTSDWEKHGHTRDPNYDNVILHVVYHHDGLSHNSIPVVELQPHIPAMMLAKYASLMSTDHFISCASMIGSVREITWLSWKERLVAERLSHKAGKAFTLLQQTHHHWEEVFWILLARSFGTKVNADAFEAIAQSVSVNILARQRSSIHQLEALLLGQANLLSEPLEDGYYKLLQREYQFLKTKYNLQPVLQAVHFLRMRPGNFPTIRLAQLAMLIHSSHHLFSKLLEAEKLAEVKEILQVTANDYWHYHYRFGQESSFKKKTLGEDAIEMIIINTIVPVLFAYGLYHKNEKLQSKALRWLEQTPAETNAVVSGFKKLSIISKTAYDSQALLELKNEYCNKKRCLECSVGNSLLKH